MEEEADRVQKPEIVIDSKETMSLGHNRTEANMNSETVATHKACKGSSQNRSQHWKKKVDLVSNPTIKLSATDTH